MKLLNLLEVDIEAKKVIRSLEGSVIDNNNNHNHIHTHNKDQVFITQYHYHFFFVLIINLYFISSFVSCLIDFCFAGQNL